MKYKYVVGIDPGSDRNGVAVYKKEKLIKLSMMRRLEVIEEFRYNNECLFSIEDVCSNNSLYRQKSTSNKGANIEKGRGIGLCQQAQKELIRDLEYYSMPYVLKTPSSKWKGEDSYRRKQPQEIKEFHLITGWGKKGNKDTRSAAYMGYLGIKDAR